MAWLNSERFLQDIEYTISDYEDKIIDVKTLESELLYQVKQFIKGAKRMESEELED